LVHQLSEPEPMHGEGELHILCRKALSRNWQKKQVGRPIPRPKQGLTGLEEEAPESG